jgi:hypothetical protein
MMKEQARISNRLIGAGDESVHRLRPVDGFVAGGEAAWDSGQNLWLLLSRPGERLIDFFLEDEDDAPADVDPIPCVCAGVLPDGTVLVGEVDWETDRFLSEMLDEQEGR